jgi:biotin--protein ligase
LGLCAGGYYAASRVEFEPGTPLEVVGDRELAFFPGVARGAAFPGFDYQTEAGSVAAQLEFRVHPLLAAQQAASHDTGAGSSSSEWASCTDYCNGGPFFASLQDGSAAAVEQLPGVTVLARYCDRRAPDAAARAGEQQQRQQRRIAAVRCRVGSGVAVLCGTHPELAPAWLDPCGESNARQGPGQRQQEEDEGGNSSSAPEGLGGAVSIAAACRDTSLAAHAQALQQALAGNQAQRDLFLSYLLLEALVV